MGLLIKRSISWIPCSAFIFNPISDIYIHTHIGNIGSRCLQVVQQKCLSSHPRITIFLDLKHSLKNDSMLHGQARLIVQDNKAAKQEIELAIGNLKDGDYTILIMDDTKNKSLPQLKYLFGVVLKTISEQLPTHPPVDALYRYFEEIYAPIHVCDLPGGEKYEYFNLKNEKASEMNEVIERIIHHVNTEWGIKVMLKDKTKMPEAKELWAGAYTEQWNLPLSKLNK